MGYDRKGGAEGAFSLGLRNGRMVSAFIETGKGEI